MSIDGRTTVRGTSGTAFSVKGLCPGVASDLARLAQASGMSVAALIREALTAYTRAAGEGTTDAISSTLVTPSNRTRTAVAPAAIASRLHHAHAVVARRMADIDGLRGRSDFNSPQRRDE